MGIWLMTAAANLVVGALVGQMCIRDSPIGGFKKNIYAEAHMIVGKVVGSVVSTRKSRCV